MTAGATGKLAEVELRTANPDANSTFTFFLSYQSPTQPVGTGVFSTTVTAPAGDGVFSIDTASANFQATAGEKFMIGVENGNTADPVLYTNGGDYGNNLWEFDPDNPSAAPYFNFGSFYDQPTDLEFATYVSTPEPSTLVTSAIGLASLALLGWRRRLPREAAGPTFLRA